MWLPQALQTIAERYPNQTAVSAGKVESLSYSELWQRSDKLALVLNHNNIGRDHRIAILAPTSIDAIVAQWAIWKCGASCVYLNEHLTPSGLQHIIAEVQPVLILADKTLQSKINADQGDGSGMITTVDLTEASNGNSSELNANSTLTNKAVSPFGDDHCNETASETIASIIYTSGSTGKPKGVCLTHSNLATVVAADTLSFGITENDSYLMAVPLHYVHGLLQLLIHLLSGARIHLLNNFMFPKVVTRTLQETAATGFSGVPFHIVALLDRGAFLETPLPDLRWMGVTGGKLAVDRIRQVRGAKPNLNIHLTYGQTECSPRISALDPEKIDQKPDSVGTPPPGIQVQLVDESGYKVKHGEIGEVLVKGDNIMAGYWADEGATRGVIDKNGWLHTGDLGYLDADGDLFLKGRKQAMIKSAGERIFPEELEHALSLEETISAVAVVGVADDLYGQRVEAHITFSDSTYSDIEAISPILSVNVNEPIAGSQPGLAERIAKVHEFCLIHIPFIRAPKHYHVWRALPGKANGKVDKVALRAWSEHYAQESNAKNKASSSTGSIE